MKDNITYLTREFNANKITADLTAVTDRIKSSEGRLQAAFDTYMAATTRFIEYVDANFEPVVDETPEVEEAIEAESIIN